MHAFFTSIKCNSNSLSDAGADTDADADADADAGADTAGADASVGWCGAAAVPREGNKSFL